MKQYNFSDELYNKLCDYKSMKMTFTKAKEEFPDADVSVLLESATLLAVEIVTEITNDIGYGELDNDFLYMLKEQYDRPE